MQHLQPIVAEILRNYPLHPWGMHGLSHWGRVLENGLAVAEASGADVEVVSLFAIFHDSRRTHDGWDLEHGQRGAKLAKKLRGKFFELPDDKFELLYRACETHTEGRSDPSVTVLTCWDADRLDLGRISVIPDPALLGTKAARDPHMIQWATQRATREHIPEFIEEAWGLRIG